MKKEEFLTELKNRLSGLPQQVIEERLVYYGELIDHRMEGGMTQEDAIASIGSLNETVGQIMTEIPLTKLVKRKMHSQRDRQVWKIVLAVCTFPIWLPVLITLFAILFAIYITGWSLMVVLFFTAIGIIAASVVVILAAFGYGAAGKPLGAVFLIGASLILLGIAILCFLISGTLTKVLVKLTTKSVLFIKSSFIRQKKEGEDIA